MSRRNLILVLTGLFYALQLAVIINWYNISTADTRTGDLLISIAIAVVVGLIDAGAARYLLAALKRSEEAFAASVNEQLERSFDEYRASAEEEERLVEEISAGVERELAHAREALAAGRSSEVSDHLQQGLSIASQIHATHCDNVPIAAVLDGKARQCAAAGIALDIQVDLPSDIGLPDVETAAIFFNLIDNARHECEALVEAGEEKPLSIHVRSLIGAGQLIVEVTNPCRTGASRRRSKVLSKEPLRTHGWGTSIVEDIARTHGGIAEYTEKDGTFSASVMIPLPQEFERIDELRELVS